MSEDVGDQLFSFYVERLNGGGILVSQTRASDVVIGQITRRALGGISDRDALIEYLTELVDELY